MRSAQPGSRLLVAGLALVLFQPASLLAVGDILEAHRPQTDFDLRGGSLLPTPAAVAEAEALGATVRWNRFGTPQVLYRPGGFLSPAPAGDPATSAREWIRLHADLFGLSDSGVDSLEVVRVSPLPDSDAYAVLFAQRAGGLRLAHDGRIKIGLVAGQVFWVSSSAVGETTDPGLPMVSAAEAWLAAATGLGLSISPSQLLTAGVENGWTLFDVAALSHPQRVRPVALALPGSGVVPAFETIVLDVQGGHAMAYTALVDGLSGDVLVRVNRTWRLADDFTGSGLRSVSDPLILGPRIETFDGEYQDAPDPQACGPRHGPYTVSLLDGWRRVVVAATAAIVTNDIFLRLYRGTTLVAEGDLATSPETLIYEPAGGVPAGSYFVEVCPFSPPPVAAVPPYAYTGTALFERTAVPEIFTVPRWRMFAANPLLDHSSVDTRILGCWTLDDFSGQPIPGCDTELENLYARAPWDHDFFTNASTLTTSGNAAVSALSWISPLTPSVPLRPIALDRNYDFPWTNRWFESGCDPLAIPFADTDAAVANLFAAHNRMHDWAYPLGFTEANGNAQIRNFGLTTPDRENDPEVGNAQAGALTGGAPSYLGRDNANQITLGDGIPPITNMYLWQPIAGAAYPNCVDGDFDMAVVGHEYGHLIQNRMVDPDNGLAGDQGRAMGESWGDLTAIEFLNAQGLVPVGGENPFAVGAYATGNQLSGVRNFPMNDSPLNFSNLDYDPVGLAVDSPHSNGEIWSAVNFDIRMALAAKYDATHPASDAVLQQRCADGELSASSCPGNRRWAQIFHDAFLLMPSTPTMLDARDAYVAADLARNAAGGWSSNQEELWRAFAARGFGQDAATSGPADVDATPGFSSPLGDNATVTFTLTAPDEGNAPVVGEIYIGRYEARSVPVADTDPTTDLGSSVELVEGTYDVLVRADGYGHHRSTLTVLAQQSSTTSIALASNWASTHQGASGSGDGADFANLLDDSEATTWQHIGATPDVTGSTVTVALNGLKTLRRAQVSAMIEPGENRFETLRAFDLLACDATVADCSLAAGYTSILSSAPDAFPGGSFRPAIEDWELRSFALPTTQATHVRLVVRTNQCTGNPRYQDSTLDNDPLNETDCRLGSVVLAPTNRDVTAAELQLFSH